MQHNLSLLLLIGGTAATLFAPTQLCAQGRSIPMGGEAREQQLQAQAVLLSEELPEGQTHRYPRFNGLNVSVDLFDPVLSLISINHCSYEAQVMANFYNRFFPMASFGMGLADETSNNGVDYGTSQKQEFTFKSSLSPFGKIGIGYNTAYNDLHPENLYMPFVRYGIAHSTADITNLYYADEAWGSVGPIDIKDQTYTTHWLELGAIIKVQLSKHFSAGWDVYWKVKIHQSGTQYGTPYYVPGLGTADAPVGFSFRLYYDIF